MAHDEFESLLASADMGTFRKMMDGPQELPEPTVHPSLYREVFSSPAGRIVLEDLAHRFVNVTRWGPGRDHSEGYYREGMAVVVFDIIDKTNQTENEE